MKLRFNMPFTLLAQLFHVHRTTASDVFKNVLANHHQVACALMHWPTRKAVDGTMPECFKTKFPRTRCVLDASEVKIEAPSEVASQVLFYSNYKASHTIKFLVSISPSGFISYISDAYGGRTTDAQITTESGILHFLESGDEVMCDKGFPSIESDLLDLNTFLVMPPFKRRNMLQFSDEENKVGYKIASIRIHVERAIARMKQFEILKFLERSLFLDYMDQILVCIAFIVNHFPPLIKQQK
ncbi:uncharacterized protein LOC131891355 [Tigriopus californicus]|nr:uncharacterized protein LOC131891355 [Tigriopus californicus]